jgi:uncharacterized membrane protein
VDAAGAIIVALRWLHVLAAVGLLGSVFLTAALMAPLLRAHPSPPLAKDLDARLREVVDVCVLVLLVSGAVLVFERLSGGQASTLYAGLLGLKVVLALLMFYQVFRARGAGILESPRTLRAPLGVGAVVLLLAVLLKVAYEGRA